MNRKGESNSMGMIGAILGMFMAVIVALAILSGGIIPIVGQTTTKTEFSNQSIVYPASSLTVQLSGREVSNFVLVNATRGHVINANNYTITNNILVDPVLTSLLNNTGVGGSGLGNGTIGTNPLATYTTESIDYIDSAGARSMVLLIAIFSALAIVVVALTPTMRSGMMDLVGK